MAADVISLGDPSELRRYQEIRKSNPELAKKLLRDGLAKIREAKEKARAEKGKREA